MVTAERVSRQIGPKKLAPPPADVGRLCHLTLGGCAMRERTAWAMRCAHTHARTMNHEHRKTDVVVGIFVVHHAAPASWYVGSLGLTYEIRRKRNARARFFLGTLSLGRKREGRSPRKVHGLVAEHFELDGVIVEAVLTQDLHGAHHRLSASARRGGRRVRQRSPRRETSKRRGIGTRRVGCPRDGHDVNGEATPRCRPRGITWGGSRRSSLTSRAC